MSIYEDIIDTSLSKYDNPGLTKGDVMSVFPSFGDLRPKLDTFVFNDGVRKTLLQLDGTVPVTYKSAVYNIPVSIWLQQSHPYSPPIVYVRPTDTMKINTGRHVDIDGKIDLPCLRDWKYPESTLLGLIQVLTIMFGEEPPVYSKLKQGIQVANGSRDYTRRTESGFNEEVIKSNGSRDYTRRTESGFNEEVIKSNGSRDYTRRTESGFNEEMIKSNRSRDYTRRTESGFNEEVIKLNGSRDYTRRTESGFNEEVIKSNDEERDSDVKCDTCQRAENVFVCANGYCVDCKEFFCKKCLRYHSRLTATKSHKIFVDERL